MGYEKFKPDKDSFESPALEEWRVRAIGGQLEKALHTEARPEFRAELKGRLLSNLPAQDPLARAPEKTGRNGWQGIFSLQGKQAAFGMLMTTMALMVCFVVVLNLTSRIPGTRSMATTTPAAAATSPQVIQEGQNGPMPLNSSLRASRSDKTEKPVDSSGSKYTAADANRIYLQYLKVNKDVSLDPKDTATDPKFKPGYNLIAK